MKENINQSLSSKILDILTPLASNGIVSISLDEIIAKVGTIPTGLRVDREMIMDLLDPNDFPMIKKIEGDSLFLRQPEVAMRAVDDQQVDKEQQKITKDAGAQAKKAIQNKA